MSLYRVLLDSLFLESKYWLAMASGGTAADSGTTFPFDYRFPAADPH